MKRLHGLMRLGVLVVAGSACGPAGGPAAQVPVRPGLEVVLSDSLHLIRGRRVAYLSNNAGVDRAGRSGVDLLREAGVHLVALFSPEHGFRGTGRPGERIPSTVDSATGLPIYSLHSGRYAPDDTMLAGLDVILVDLPDVGARFYTYSYTTIEVMKAAAEHGVRVIVLDRPNPIGGAVQGNVLDPGYRSVVGSLAVPLRHGLTLGELARLAARDDGIPVDLTVVPVAGWRRDMGFDATGLPFVRPSPNLKDVDALFHYPGLGLFEGTNVSVGRGTDWPFHVVGAPWLDTARVLAGVRAEGLPGVRFEGVEFRPVEPGDGKFDRVQLRGVRLVATDRGAYDPVAAAVALLVVLQREHPDSFRVSVTSFDRHAGGPGLREAIQAGQGAREIVAEWAEAREAWVRGRVGVLLYR
jgi:uncharacterized protein YbbC (DUF1343 family)